MDAPPLDAKVAAVFAGFPTAERDRLMQFRALIFSTAAQIEGVGAVQETLKWGQPAYLTPQTKSGTTIRLGVGTAGHVGVYTHCQSSVMADFQVVYPDTFDVVNNRAAHFAIDEDIPMDALARLFRIALTYHQKR